MFNKAAWLLVIVSMGAAQGAKNSDDISSVRKHGWKLIEKYQRYYTEKDFTMLVKTRALEFKTKEFCDIIISHRLYKEALKNHPHCQAEAQVIYDLVKLKAVNTILKKHLAENPDSASAKAIKGDIQDIKKVKDIIKYRYVKEAGTNQCI